MKLDLLLGLLDVELLLLDLGLLLTLGGLEIFNDALLPLNLVIEPSIFHFDTLSP